MTVSSIIVVFRSAEERALSRSERRQYDEHDPAIDPPPDLGIEIDVSSSSTTRMPIYADLGIAEVWRWKDDELDVFQLDVEGRYIRCGESRVLPGFPIATAVDILRRRSLADETALLRGFREFVRNEKS